MYLSKSLYVFITLLVFVHYILSGPPSIIIGPQDEIRREGDEVVFTCFATGDPEPVVTWTFNNTVIQTNTTKYSIGGYNNTYMHVIITCYVGFCCFTAPITEGEDFGSLTVRNISYYDKGEYTCTVTNSNGTSSDSAVLLVQGTNMYMYVFAYILTNVHNPHPIISP